MTIDVTVPDIGDFSDVEIIEILVGEGDEIEEEGSLLTLESDKATMEIPSPVTGRVVSVKVAVGERVSEGDLILTMEQADAAATTADDTTELAEGDRPLEESEPAITQAPLPAAAPAAEPAPASHPLPGETEQRPVPIEAAAPDRITSGIAHASPSVRRFAREVGVDLSTVSGSGPGGRIVERDVRAAAEGAAPAAAPARECSSSTHPPAPRLPLPRTAPARPRPQRNWAATSQPGTRDWAQAPRIRFAGKSCWLPGSRRAPSPRSATRPGPSSWPDDVPRASPTTPTSG